jgi:FkbM family methyltransferase
MCPAEPSTKQHDLIYDVGMHRGEDTDFYLKKGFRVIGFEADPELAGQCRTRFAREIDDGRLTVVEGAVVPPRVGSAEGRSIRFYRNRQASVWGTVVDDWARRNETFGAPSEIIDVHTVDFGQCLVRYGIPHYMKVDIEGSDLVCLEALRHQDARPDYVSIESEKRSFARLRDELRLLRRLGYTGFKAVEQQGVPMQVEPLAPREGSYVGYRFEAGASGLFGEDLPGAWKNYGQILDRYRVIFLLYGLFGDSGITRRHLAGRMIRRALLRRVRRPLPGWYDTHARHASVAARHHS